MTSPAVAPVNPAQTLQQTAVAVARVRIGAKWFYWIAGLSLINSLAAISGGNFHFVIGLGITSVVDALAKQTGSAGSVLDVVINGFIGGVFVLFGYFACKLQRWAFLAGMALYALDAVLVLAAKDILSVAFHAYALFAIYRGFSFLNQAQAPTPVSAMNSAPIQPR